MQHPLSRLARHVGLFLFCLSSIGVAGYALTYLYGEYEPGNPLHRSFATAGWPVPMHFLGAGLALLVAPLQVSGRLRRRWPRVHRLNGWLYTLAVGLGGVAGLALSTRAQGGWSTGSAFALLAILWITTTAVAVAEAVRGRIPSHQRWMLRSIALTYAAVTLRIMLPLGIGGFGWSFGTAYLVAAWGCWTINGALMEVYLRTCSRPVGAVSGEWPARVTPSAHARGTGSASRPAGA